MGKINLDNYEAYFLDLMEDNLAEDDRRELAVFLNMHPELKAELEEDFGDVTLVPETETFEAKGSLKATDISFPITSENIEDLMIAHIEGQLTKEHDALVLEFIHANKLDRTLAAYEATVLSANKEEVFTDKTAVKAEVISVLVSEINEANAEDFMIGYHEETLSSAERMAIVQYVEKHDLQKAFASFALIKLEADPTEVFQNKAALKKSTGRVIPLYARVASVAAVGLLILGLAINWNPDPELTEGSESKGLFVADENHGEDLIDRESPEHIIPSTNDSYAYVADEDNSAQAVAVIVDEQFVDNSNDSLINPIRKDSLPKIVIPNDLHNNNDEIDIVKHDPIKEESDSAVTAPVLSEDIAEAVIEREEPLKVITNLASNVFKREVTFTRDKDVASEEYVAYGFKLGRFEFQRKKSRKL